MRMIAFAVMAALAVVSVIEGELALALVFAGLKALLVGLGYMELRGAARPHAVGFTLAMVALTGGLVAVVGP